MFDPMSRGLSRRCAADASRRAAQSENDAARAGFDRSLWLNPKNGDAHAGLARLYVRQGDDATAAGHYRCAVRFAPGNGEYAAELADCLSRQSRVSLDRQRLCDGALRAYRYARSIDVDDESLALRHGRFARDAGRLEEAIGCFSDAASLSPGSVEPRLELARTYEMAGDDQSAGRVRREARHLQSVMRGRELGQGGEAGREDPVALDRDSAGMSSE